MMHAAKLDRSPRLQRVLKLLKRKCECSTLDIIYQARVAAVSAIVSELRQAGYDIRCERRGDIWYYRMVKA